MGELSYRDRWSNFWKHGLFPFSSFEHVAAYHIYCQPVDAHRPKGGRLIDASFRPLLPPGKTSAIVQLGSPCGWTTIGFFAFSRISRRLGDHGGIHRLAGATVHLEVLGLELVHLEARP
jgi:hypothetical protein